MEGSLKDRFKGKIPDKALKYLEPKFKIKRPNLKGNPKYVIKEDD